MAELRHPDAPTPPDLAPEDQAALTEAVTRMKRLLNKRTGQPDCMDLLYDHELQALALAALGIEARHV